MEMSITTTVQHCVGLAENRFRSKNDLPPEHRKQQSSLSRLTRDEGDGGPVKLEKSVTTDASH